MVVIMAQIKKQHFIRYVVYGVLGLAAVSCIVYFFIIKPIQIRNQKQNFAKAEARLDDLEKQIEQKIGKPDQIKKDKSCSYASRVYERGPRVCGISIYMLYANRNLDFANRTLKSATDLVGTKLYNQLLRDEASEFTPYDGRGASQSFSQALPNPGNLNCSIQYLFPVVPLHDKTFPDASGENVEIALSCGAPAMAELYPVKK